MRNLKLTLAYDGTPYHGWQIQPGVSTVQGELERTLESLLNHSVSTHGSGRTDAGVHAHGQVVHFHTEGTMDTDALHKGVNALLPPEIRITAVEEVPLEFHARRSARSKTYEYHVWRSSVVSPFHSRYVQAVGQYLDFEAVEQATGRFSGVHDFTSFSAISSEDRNPVREVYEALWERDSQKWVFRIRANGFLRYMVRTIVGTLLEVGRGRLEWQEIDRIFEAKDRRRAGPSAPPKGLHLVSVDY